MKQKEQVNRIYMLTEEEIRAEYEKKDITDDFIFGKVMENPVNSIPMLEFLTGNKIESVNTIITQKAIKITSDGKGVRYDVYVEDDKDIVYDTEMQNRSANTDTLPRRVRFYQGMIDLNILESGADYDMLKESYVIFICTFDPFGKDLCCYEFENILFQIKKI